MLGAITVVLIGGLTSQITPAHAEMPASASRTGGDAAIAQALFQDARAKMNVDASADGVAAACTKLADLYDLMASQYRDRAASLAQLRN